MKKKKHFDNVPYKTNPDITVEYELIFKKDIIKPGDNIRIKNARGLFKFKNVATNSKLGVTWVDCLELSTMHARSFYVDKVKGIYRPRQKRKKIV